MATGNNADTVCKVPNKHAVNPQPLSLSTLGAGGQVSSSAFFFFKSNFTHWFSFYSQIAFPGFGYWPRWYADTFRNLSLKAALPNYLNDTELRNRNLCDIVTYMYKEGVVPNRNLALDRIEEGVSGIMCPPLWDRASCFPATHAGQMSVIPCMAEFNEVYYDTTGRRAFLMTFTPGVNFINALRTAFTLVDPESVKNTW